MLEGAGRSAGAILTLGHGLEVQFPAVASEPRHGASPDLEDVDGSLLEAADDHCVGWASDDRGVQVRVVLEDDKRQTQPSAAGLWPKVQRS